jgi:hypothetical protein
VVTPRRNVHLLLFSFVEDEIPAIRDTLSLSKLHESTQAALVRR